MKISTLAVREKLKKTLIWLQFDQQVIFEVATFSAKGRRRWESHVTHKSVEWNTRSAMES